MILADKIIYERKKNGWSQEELADMLGVSRQSVSKWEGAQSIPDLQKILKMAELFQVSTDYLLKDEIEPDEREITYENDHTYETAEKRIVSMEEASDFLITNEQCLPKIGIGVFLCITCPAILLIMCALSESRMFGLREEPAIAIGLFFLFVQIGIAVALFIQQGLRLERYDYLQKETFETAYGVDGMVKAVKAQQEHRNHVALISGILLCIFSPVPLILSALMNVPDYVLVCLVALLLFLVALGVYLFIAVCGIHGACMVLLQDGDFAPSKKMQTQKLEPVTKIYWLLTVAIYLGVSFATNAWHYTWIIWPVAGILFAVVHAIAEAICGTKKEEP